VHSPLDTPLSVGGGTAVPVVFELCKHCPFGHTFALVGDALELGEWDVSKALRLEVRLGGGGMEKGGSNCLLASGSTAQHCVAC
jgi:hypothetical protein